jgi:PASTA domain
MLGAASGQSVPTIGNLPGWTVLVTVAAVIILSGLVVIIGRKLLDGGSSDASESLVRSWIAISLVGGLLVFCAVAFSIGDSALRSTLFGGLVASVGAAIAFYFSTKSAEQARQDVITAAVGTTTVPDLVNKTLDESRALVATTPLQLVVGTAQAQGGDRVSGQSPAAGSSARNGASVTIQSAPVAAGK